MYGKDIARGKDPGNKSRRRDIICKTGIQTGKDPGNVKWTNPFGMGYATVVAAARASLNMGNEAVVNTGYTWVTKKNLKTDEVQKILYSK